MINDNECGTPADKLRLFLIHYLCSNNITEQELSDASKALEEIGADSKALVYMKRLKSLMQVNF